MCDLLKCCGTASDEDKKAISEMAQWWEDEFIRPMLDLEEGGDPLYSDEDGDTLNLMAMVFEMPMAMSGLSTAHGLDPEDKRHPIKVARLIQLYSYMVGTGKVKPGPFPFTPQRLCDMQMAFDLARMTWGDNHQ